MGRRARGARSGVGRFVWGRICRLEGIAPGFFGRISSEKTRRTAEKRGRDGASAGLGLPIAPTDSSPRGKGNPRKINRRATASPTRVAPLGAPDPFPSKIRDAQLDCVSSVLGQSPTKRSKGFHGLGPTLRGRVPPSFPHPSPKRNPPRTRAAFPAAYASCSLQHRPKSPTGHSETVKEVRLPSCFFKPSLIYCPRVWVLEEVCIFPNLIFRERLFFHVFD